MKLVEIPEGWGWGVIFVLKKNGNSGEEGGGDLREIPSVGWWGYGYFLELHNQN